MKKFLIAAFVVLLNFIPVACAEVVTVEADGYYTVGDGPDENISVAKERARAEAKRNASEQACVYVESISEVKNGALTRDEIQTISATVLKICNETVSPEILSDSVIQFHCHITARVETADVLAQVNQGKDKLIEATQRNKELEEENARIKAELAELKARYKTANADERKQIDAEVKRNEEQFTAVQWNDKGYALNNKKEFAAAIECFNKAIALEPHYAKAWNNLGYAYESLGDTAGAIDCFNKSIEFNPNYAAPWNNLGYIHSKFNEHEQAARCYRRAIEINPKYVLAQNNLAFAYNKLGDYDKAIACSLKTIELDSNYAKGWNNLGVAYFKQKRWREAADAFGRAAELDPTDKTMAENRDAALAKIG